MMDWIEDWLIDYGAMTVVVGLFVALIAGIVYGLVVHNDGAEAKRAKAARVKKLELDHAVLKERLRRCKPMEGKP